jgi:hypothetical protein
MSTYPFPFSQGIASEKLIATAAGYMAENDFAHKPSGVFLCEDKNLSPFHHSRTSTLISVAFYFSYFTFYLIHCHCIPLIYQFFIYLELRNLKTVARDSWLDSQITIPEPLNPIHEFTV